jgi:hypothetical protein
MGRGQQPFLIFREFTYTHIDRRNKLFDAKYASKQFQRRHWIHTKKGTQLIVTLRFGCGFAVWQWALL